MTAKIEDLPRDQRPLSEQFRIVAKKWADIDNAAYLMIEMKTTVLEQMKTHLIDADPKLSDAKAERLVKSSPEWEKYIRDMCKSRGEASLRRQQLKYLEMRHREWISADANARKELNL